jgi:hypothetical protein
MRAPFDIWGQRGNIELGMRLSWRKATAKALRRLFQGGEIPGVIAFTSNPGINEEV